MLMVHRFQATLFPVNAYLVETDRGVVIIDSTLGVSDGRALRARAESLGKPLLAVVITHAHPDHYGALTSVLEGLDVPVIATEGVDRVIRRDDEAKERILRPMFGAEWAAQRTFPNRTVRAGQRMVFDGVTFTVIDLGPGESPHDSVWLVDRGGESAPLAFVGDLVYGHMHAYLADGYYEQWLGNLERARREIPADTILYMGHGEPGPAASLFDWQAAYIRTFIDAVRATEHSTGQGAADDAATTAVLARMKRYLPSDDLLFLMQLSVAPMRARLAAARRSRASTRC
jgi:glyoxylase-like metal-dependent hydrolase (beta-lactamase superfamily II)